MSGREQKLIDIAFELVGVISDPKYAAHFEPMTHEERMDWVAHQLRQCGFDTSPVGMSWGVLRPSTN